MRTTESSSDKVIRLSNLARELHQERLFSLRDYDIFNGAISLFGIVAAETILLGFADHALSKRIISQERAEKIYRAIDLQEEVIERMRRTIRESFDQSQRRRNQ